MVIQEKSEERRRQKRTQRQQDLTGGAAIRHPWRISISTGLPRPRMSSSLLDHHLPELSPAEPFPAAGSPCRDPLCAAVVAGVDPAPVLRLPCCGHLRGAPAPRRQLLTWTAVHPLHGLRARLFLSAVLELDDEDVIWGAGGAVASSPVDMY